MPPYENGKNELLWCATERKAACLPILLNRGQREILLRM